MSYHESQCTVLLHPREEHDFSFGDSLYLLTNGARDLPVPISTPRFPLTHSADRTIARPRIFWAIFEEPHGTGINPYLLLSMSYLPAQQAVHAAALARQERHSGWRAQWFGTSKADLCWQGDAFFRLRACLSAKLLDAIWTLYGHPHDEAAWLASALMPRRRGATFLMPTPTLLQLWVRLF